MCVFLADIIMMIKSRVGHVVYVKGITGVNHCEKPEWKTPLTGPRHR